MKNTFYTLLIVLLAVVNLQAQEYRDFIEEAQKQLGTPMNGVIGGPFGAGNGVVGAIGGSVSVGGLGAATYTIPIDVPQGIGDLKPSLSIVYNSQSSNGLLGWGWTLGGLSAITRVGKNLFLDNEMDGVDFDSDKFALDGQRLIEVRGNYGENGTEYRTEVDGMSRIVSYTEDGTSNGPAKFMVWTSDGLILEYGYNNDVCHSRVQWNCSDSPNNKEVGIWLLNCIKDRNGNSIEYHYVVGGANYYISSISYTTNESISLYPCYWVNFSYYNGRREDVELTFVGNHQLYQNKLLKSISINWRRPQPWSLEEVSRYDFDYYGIDTDHGYQYNRLKSITFCSDGITYNPTIIDWGNNEYNNPTSDFRYDQMGMGWNNVKNIYVGDFNGDGMSDILQVYYVDHDEKYYGEVFYSEILIENGRPKLKHRSHERIKITDSKEESFSGLVINDFDGDGRDDVTVLVRIYSGNYLDKISVKPFLNCWYSNLEDWRLCQCYCDINDDKPFISKNVSPIFFAGDFLGRGKKEMILQIHSGDYNQKNKFFYIKYRGDCHFESSEKDADVIPRNFFPLAATDLNGDGIDEFPCRTAIYGDQLLKMTSESEACYHHIDGDLSHESIFNIGDFNGDGKMDYLYRRSSYGNGNPYSWWINLFKESNVQWELDVTEELPSSKFSDHPIVTDMNGDGKADFVAVYEDHLYIFYGPVTRISDDSPKGRFSAKQVFNLNDTGLTEYDDWPFVAGNFFGKENSSIIGVHGVFCLPTISDRYSVDTIKDGMGNEICFEYDYLMPSNSFFYKRWRGYDDQANDIFTASVPIKALKCMKTSNPLARTPIATVKYYYRNAIFHKKGHGALGFLTTAYSSYIDNTKIDSTICNFSTEPLLTHRALVLQSQYTFNGLNKLVKRNAFANSFVRSKQDNNFRVYIPIVTKIYTCAYDPDRGEEALLSKSITENHYQIDYFDENTGISYYYDFLRLPDVYTGMTTNPWAASVSECPYQTQTHTNYQEETQTMLDNWVINRPESTMVSAWKTGDNDISESLITYEYRDSHSHLPQTVTSYPGGDISNANGLATATTYKYDLAGNVIEETLSAIDGSLNPRTTSYTYHNYRFPESETNAIGYTSKSNYNQQYGEIMWSKDCNNQVTFYNYSDHLGSSSWVQYPDLTYGCTALRWAYDENGHLVPDAPSRASYYSWKRISGDAPVQVFFDAAGRELRTVAIGLNGKVIYQDTDYNSMGLVFKKSLPYFKDDTPIWTSYYYDGLLRPTDTYLPDGTHTTIKYDGLTTTSLFFDTHGHVRETSQTNNYLGQVTKSVDAMGTEVNYHYYHDGKLRYTQIGNDEDTRITLEYDDAGNRTILFDPNYGKVVDTYDAFGQLRSTTTPKGDVTQCHYDDLGRMDWRLENDHQATTTTRTTWTYNEAEGQKGLLARIQYDDVQSISFCYDASHLNRLASKTETLNSNEYTTLYTYDDACGFPLRVRTVTYPTKYTIQNEYEAGTGILCRINDVNGKMLWQANLTNALGQITESLMGNGVTNKRGYSPQTGRLESIKSFSGQQILQDLLYGYDDFGNLAARTDNQKGLTEEFKYDELDRLETTFLNGEMTGLMAYDSYGRIRRKEADGNLVFDATGQGCYRSDKPHAIRQAELEGNPFPSAQLDMTYTMFDKVSAIRQGRGRAIFAYGYDHERISMEEFNDNGWKRTKTYVGGCEYYDDPNGKHSLTHLVGPTGVFAVAEQIGDGNSFNLHYIHKDHLGSWVAQTDEWGNLEEESSYDAWGNRRDPYTWTGSVAQLPMFDRGFTGHEHLYGFDLINMNGRMYDPVMSSFLSVDNYVQSPENSQNFNRYAYCLNNPLKYVDPSGEEFAISSFIAAAVIGGAISVITNGIENLKYGVGFFVGAGEKAFIGGMQGIFSCGVGYGAEAIVSSIGDEALAFLTQQAFQAVAHGTIGGLATYIRSGNFWAGFASGAVSSVISGFTGRICLEAGMSKSWARITMIAAGGLSGGVTSTMAGGDFWDGVCNGLISSGLNHAMHMVVEGGVRLAQFKMMTQDAWAKNPEKCKFFALAMAEYSLLGDKARTPEQIEEAWNEIAKTETEESVIYQKVCAQNGIGIRNTQSTVNGIDGIEMYDLIDSNNPVLVLSYYKNFFDEYTRAHARVLIGVGDGKNSFEIADPMYTDTYYRTSGNMGKDPYNQKITLYNEFYYFQLYKK